MRIWNAAPVSAASIFGLALVFSFALAPPLAAAEGDEIAGACTARELGDAETCACAQQVAESDLRASLHELAAEFLGKRVTTGDVAARSGRSGAESFEFEYRAFKSAVRRQCGLKLR
ncbi:MAG: hypothetical protein AAF415_17660 [Pseudomonadota bacterium]